MLVRGGLGRGQIIALVLALVAVFLFIQRPEVPSLKGLDISETVKHYTGAGKKEDPAEAAKLLEGITTNNPYEKEQKVESVGAESAVVESAVADKSAEPVSSTAIASSVSPSTSSEVVLIHTATGSPSKPSSPSHAKARPLYEGIPRKIWQTWKARSTHLDEDMLAHTQSWQDKNPKHRYELLTDDAAVTYIEDTFADQPDVVETFTAIQDVILRADLTRYLILQAEGGVYVDMDTDCTRPIDQWLPEKYRNNSGLVVGVEYDASLGGGWADFETEVQLCQWAIAAKPGHPVVKHIVDRVLKALRDFAEPSGQIHVHELNDVLKVTGPRVFHAAILESLSSQMGRQVSEEDLRGMTEAKQIGDVLILPVNAFGSGQGHSQSKPFGNDEELLSHHFHGWVGWKSDFS